MIVCEMTKDQTKACSSGPIWSLTIESLWYTLTLDTQVPVLLIIFIYVPFGGSHGFGGCKRCCILSAVRHLGEDLIIELNDDEHFPRTKC